MIEVPQAKGSWDVRLVSQCLEESPSELQVTFEGSLNTSHCLAFCEYVLCIYRLINCTNQLIHGTDQFLIACSVDKWQVNSYQSISWSLINRYLLMINKSMWLAVSRILLLVFCGTNLIGQPAASRQPTSQPAFVEPCQRLEECPR